MFLPFRLREMDLVNRIAVSPMAMYSAVDGTPTDFHLVHFGARALGGAGLIFTERDRIDPLLREKKIQIIFSGKSHPLDDGGKEIVAELVRMSREYPESVVFLADYDIETGKQLVRGCDVWLNNPRRPKEASGTSGMKAAMNGVLNMSILDGWWPEACMNGTNGWRIGDTVVPDSEEDHMVGVPGQTGQLYVVDKVDRV